MLMIKTLETTIYNGLNTLKKRGKNHEEEYHQTFH